MPHTAPGENPDYATQELYEAIEAGNYPGWIMYAQVLTPEQAQNFKYNVLDLTKYALNSLHGSS